MKESRGITPLRTILQNCLNHIENLETNRSISDNYDKEFQDLKQFSETLKTQKEFACTEGEKEVNRKKNRYKDILPFNISRVILSEYAGVPGSDYINANYIKGASGSPAYIASQGPLPNTVNDFWRMVVECEVQVIVMACNAQESGKHKCENYWVEKEGEEKKFGMVQICLVKASTVCPDFLVRTMRLKYTNDKDVTEERTVCQFHYSAWPDHGVPPLVRPLLDMVRLVRDTQASETLPVLVHCSAGCGRTGTICAIDFVWGLLRAGKLTEEFSLFNLVRDMRKQRVAMVQTKEQYILVHQAVRELFKEQLRVIESHPYENIDFNGVPLIKDFEEPFYDTISIQKEENCDEKQDKSELKEKEEVDIRLPKADTAPPLPRKKRPNVLFSKQEKEAENLTEKNRSSFAEKEKEKEKTDAPLSSILGKPRIVKLRALFEKSPTTKERNTLKDRGSQTVSRSHSLGAIRKPLTAEVFEPQIERSKPVNAPQPISDHAKLKQSKSFSKSVPLIKRSKSLKTFSQSPHLCVSPPNPAERKVIKNYQPKPENHVATANSNAWKAPTVISDVPPGLDLAKECSKRRRSLESLMGDVPPNITWPTVVMAVDKSYSYSKTRQKPLNWSPKQNFSTIQGSKTAELLKHQLQRLSLETEKKMNTFASGIGIRERRNSFRQAVTKSDIQNVFRDYREQHVSPGKKVLGNESRWDGSKSVKNSSDGLQLADQADGIIYLEREAPTDVKLMRSKSVFDIKKYRTQEKLSGESVKKFNGRHPLPQNYLSVASNQMILEPRMPKSILSSKTSRTYEDLERSGDPKNLFLKKLNSEIQSERERESASSETRSRSSYEDSDKLLTSRFAPGPISVHSDTKKTLFKTNSNVGKTTSSYSIKQENFDEFDGPNGRFDRPVEVESNGKVYQSGSRQNFQGQQTYVKPQKLSKPVECYKCYTAPPAPHPVAYGRTNAPQKVVNYQISVGEGPSNLRREEMPQEVRHKEPFFSISHKKNVFCVVPSKVHSRHDNEVTFGSYRRNPNSDLYVAISPEFETNDKKLMLPPKITDKSSKNYESLSWSQTPSQRSSSEMTSSDSKSESSRSATNENVSKPEVILIKKPEPTKGIGKIRLNESIKSAASSDQTSSNKQKRIEDQKISSEFCNYGIVGTSKMKQNPPKYSKDDFLLEEPTAPPRVKRHASVTVPRNTINGSDHVSSWVSSENKMANNRNANSQVDKNPWSESFGVDLDAVAASMQQDKREAGVLKDAVWSSKNHLSTATNTNVKKKQHYF